MVTIPGSTRVLESSIDWVTATFRPGTKSLLASAMATRWLEARQRDGFTRSEWVFNGYLGERTDGISVGSRTDGEIVRLSGALAKAHGATILRLSDNISRLDLQVTIQTPESNTDWPTDAFDTSARDPRCVAGLTRRQLLDVQPGGTTFYLGSRTSERFFRIYDKHAESEGLYPPSTWRWEVEYKGARALTVARRLQQYKVASDEVRAVVEGAFADYAISLPCEPLPRKWRDAGIRGETDDERRMEWLRRSVGPLVSRLLESTDPTRIMDALGLEAYSDFLSYHIPDDRTAGVIWTAPTSQTSDPT